jgi:hypothetical protein
LGIATTAVVMALTVEAVGAYSAGDGAVLGLVLGAGFGATLSSWPPMLMQVATGAILGAWR